MKTQKCFNQIIASVILLIIIFGCESNKSEKIKNHLPEKVAAGKSKFVSIAIEDIITTLTVENRNNLIREIEKEHKHNDFVTIETSEKDSPIIIIFEKINGANIYTGSRTTYNKHNEKRTKYFTTLTPKQLKKLKDGFNSGWKDDK